MLADFFYGHPGYIVGPAVVGFFTLLGLAGQVLIFRLVPARLRDENRDATIYMASTVGIIYAVLLAFIAVAAWENYNNAGEVAVDEASQIANLYRSSRLLEPWPGDAVGRRLEQYVETVIGEEWPAMAGGRPVGESGTVLLEEAAALLVKSLPDDAKSAALLQEMLSRLHDAYEARKKRLLAADEALNPSIWVVQLLGGLISLGFCWIFGTPHRGFHMVATSLVATAFGLVIFLIVSFDHPYRGAVQIGPDPFQRLHGSIERMKVSPR